MRSAPITTLCRLAAAAIATAWLTAGPVSAQEAVPPPVDYAADESWLCRPGRLDACAVDLSTTVIDANGTMTVQPFVPHADPPVDCFYVYPTASRDPSANSDLVPGREERIVAAGQAARFRAECRLFAPMYRQFTLTLLESRMASPPTTLDQVVDMASAEVELAYRDVRDAWHAYLARDNGGRGVVLIGHSQGAVHLRRLIQEEIDGTPLQSRIVSAMLLGATVDVPPGRDVGGTFKSFSLCRSASQTGCVISYASFRAAAPPQRDAFFVRPNVAGMEAACTNPAALEGGAGPLDARLAAGEAGVFRTASGTVPWVRPVRPLQTLFVSVPGLLSAECRRSEHGAFLAVTVHADAADPRADDIAGDMAVRGKALSNWGLHRVDVHLAIGNLVDLVGRQAAAFARRASP